MKKYYIKAEMNDCVIEKSENIFFDTGKSIYICEIYSDVDDDNDLFTKQQADFLVNYLSHKSPFISNIQVISDEDELENDEIQQFNFHLYKVDKFNDFKSDFNVIATLFQKNIS